MMKQMGMLAALTLLPLSGGCGSFTLNPFDVDAPRRVPTIALKTPSAPASPADTEFVIQVEFGNVTISDTWSLYAVTDAHSSKGIPIVEDIPVTVRTLRWDPTELPSGLYYLFGELKSLDGVITASAPGSILVDHPMVAGNSSPVVALTSPNGGESYAPGDVVTVTYTATDADGDALTYDLEISSDGGNTWTELAADVPSGSYEWTVPTSQTLGLSYRLRIRATDSDEATDADMSNGTFSIQ
jgi:hypothetical protein